MRAALAFLLAGAAPAALAADPAAMAGIWKFELEKLIGSMTMYTELFADGTCRQVAKAKVVGVTHWATDECTWVVDGDKVTTKVTAGSDPKMVGTTSVVTIKTLTADTFVFVTDKDDEATYTRVPAIPPEFLAKFTPAKAPPR